MKYLRQFFSIAIAGFLGGALAAGAIAVIVYDQSNLFNVLSSLATLAAALIALFTLREMRSSRVDASRGRLSPADVIGTLQFTWDLKTNTVAGPTELPTVTIRNASNGSASNVHATWQATTKLLERDLEDINSMLPEGSDVVVSQSTYRIEFRRRTNIVLALPIAGRDDAELSDLGPGHEFSIELPLVVANYVVVKWLALAKMIIAGRDITSADIPIFTLGFQHNSPYEADITNRHLLRFHIVEFVARDLTGAQVSRHPKAKTELSSLASLQFVVRPVPGSLAASPRPSITVA